MKAEFEHSSGSFSLELVPDGRNYTVTIGDQTFLAQVLKAENGRLDLVLNGERVTAYLSGDGARRWVTVQGRTFLLARSSRLKGEHGRHDHESGLTAPMPGQVRAVNASEGEAVKKGQTLLVLEAMKMEIRVQAPRDGLVKRVFVQQGETVEREQLLIEVSEP
jgi:acetyl/propionyl-CoA carboxylase alpha subunit